MDTLTKVVDVLNQIDLTGPKVAAGCIALVSALIALILVARKAKHFKLAMIGTAPVLAIVLGTTIDGANRFSSGVLHSHGIEVWFPAIVFEAVAFNIASKAASHHEKYKDGPGIWGNRLYYIGVLAGAIVATGADTVGGKAFRFAMPVIGVWLVILSLTPDKADTDTKKSSWRWTPNNFLIWAGIRKPGENDIEEVQREFRVKTLSSVAHNLNTGTKLTAWWYETRLKRLALTTAEEIVSECEDNVHRAATIIDRLKPETIAGNRQRRAEIEAAKAETELLRISAHEAAGQAEKLAATISSLQLETATIRQALAEAEMARQVETGNAERLADRLTWAEKRAEEQAETIRKQDAELEKLRQRPVEAPRRPTTGNRQLITMTPLETGNTFPVVEKVSPATVAAVVSAWTANPTATQAEISSIAGVCDRTVRTVLKAIRQPATPEIFAGNGNRRPETNGNTASNLITTN